jgi:hypothetical protein
MRWLLILIFSLYSVQAGAQLKSQQGERVVLIGDSEAFLLAAEFPRLAEADGASFAAVTVPGSSVISWSIEGPWHKVRYLRPTILLIALGANDACIGARVVRNEKPYLSRFLRRVAAMNAAQVIWLGPPDIGSPSKLPQARAGLAAFASMVQDTGTFYLDARTISVGMWDDALHCSRPQYPGDPSSGCQTWASWAWSSLSLIP